MNKNDVKQFFKITNLNEELCDDVLSMNNLNQNAQSEYDINEVFRAYSKAITFFSLFVPEYYAAELLDMDIKELEKMELEYIHMPSEMQFMFYDEYHKNKFYVSKYLYRSDQVYNIFKVIDKAKYLEIFDDVKLNYPTAFVSLTCAVKSLGFTKIKPQFYHYHLMNLNIRFAKFGNERRYFDEDIKNIIDVVDDFFEKYISFNELKNIYGFSIVDYMLSKKLLTPDWYSKQKYDVVFSDDRYLKGFSPSLIFFERESVNSMYLEWFEEEIMNKFKIKVSDNSKNVYECTIIEDFGVFYIRKSRVIRNNYYLEYFKDINTIDSQTIIDMFGLHSYLRKIIHNSLNHGPYYETYLDVLVNDLENSIFCYKKEQILNISQNIKSCDKNELPYFYRLNDVIVNKFKSQIVYYQNELHKESIKQIIPERYLNHISGYIYSEDKNIRDIYAQELDNVLIIQNTSMIRGEIKYYNVSKRGQFIFLEQMTFNTEYISIIEGIKFLNLGSLSFSLAWSNILNCGLDLYYFDEKIYLINNEVIKIRNKVSKFLEDYISVNELNRLVHSNMKEIDFDEIPIVPPISYYYLLPEDKRGFIFYQRVSNDLIDNLFNISLHYSLFLSQAEVENNLYLLPSNIPQNLALKLLDIKNNKFSFNKFWDKYASNTDIDGYCKRDGIIQLISQQNDFFENYVFEDKIIEYLDLEIDSFSLGDKELLETLVVYYAPDYITLKFDYNNLRSNRAYRKGDLISLQDYFHKNVKNPYSMTIDNSISHTDQYKTYLLREKPLGLSSRLLQYSSSTYAIWQEYIELQIKTRKTNEKVTNGKINQYINALNTLVIFLEELKVFELNKIKTGDINRFFKRINSVTYQKILEGFFRYSAAKYLSKGITYVYKLSDINISTKKSMNKDELLPQIYNFSEYSRLFNYCNDYYLHIEKAIEEIKTLHTATYASTWFYIMSHLNNAWRSSDIAFFPLVDVQDILERILSNNDVMWFCNNRLTKTDSTIIALRIQNNPKVISKTKKYTRFMCSDELLETYTSLYLLLTYFTDKYMAYDNYIVCHFENNYNGVSNAQLNTFFSKIGKKNFRFKSRKLNKTLLTMIDFMEDFYCTNELDIERRQAMLLRSHVKQESTLPYIKRTKETFDRLTNMICARGEFGYAYEMLLKTTMKEGIELSHEEMTDEIRKIRYMVPNIKDIDAIYGFLNFTHHEISEITAYIHSLTLEELQSTLTKVYLERLGSQISGVSCIKKTCTKANSNDKEQCAYCIFHIPSIYSLTFICQSIKEDLKYYQQEENELLRKKSMAKIIKKSRDIIWAKEKYGTEVLQEIFLLSKLEFDAFMIALNNLIKTDTQEKLLIGEKI